LKEVKQSLEEESETQECEVKNLKTSISKLNKQVDDLDFEFVEYTKSEGNHKNKLNKKIVGINQMR
jgi:hypothetical protein